MFSHVASVTAAGGWFPALPQSAADIALDGIRTRNRFNRDREIYAQGDVPDSWFKVISGTVRMTNLLPDGRRHIAAFCFAGDCFGLDSGRQRTSTAEAIGEVTVMRFGLSATGRVVDQHPVLARRLCAMTLSDLAQTQGRLLLLARLTATERVARFLVELADRRDIGRRLDVPMSRYDIADYLGLTVETVCRVLSAMKRDGVIAMPGPHRIDICDREAVDTLAEG